MNKPNEANDTLNVVATALLWCFAFSMVFMLVWLAVLIFGGDWPYQLHGKIFRNISRSQFEMAHYVGLMICKGGAFGLFLFPCLGIKLAQRKHRQ